jgi:tetratricopeptide (TPR) repeat protein
MMSRPITAWQFGSRWSAWLFVLILAAATIFAYRPAWHGGFLWDDDRYVTNNKLLTAPDGLRRIWFSLDSPSQYFPLVYTTFRIEHGLWGLNPFGYHWVNILLHVANAVLLWRLLVRLNVPGAWLAGAIFALHPVQVESVAWITERKNVLMGFFFLLTLLAWTTFVDQRTNRPWRCYVLALVLYGLALSAKSTACVLPVTLLLILWLQRKRINWEDILQVVPFFLLALGMGLVAVWWERYHQGTRGALFALSLIERILIASRAIWFYLGKLIWPSTLTFIYPRWTISPANPLAYAWLLALGGVCALICFARRYAGRSIEVAAIFFVATLSPVLGFIMLYTFRYTFVADHYQYLACIGSIALGCAGMANLAKAATGIHRRLLFGIAVCVVAALAVLTWRQSTMYGDIEALWRTTLARNPSCWMAHNNLGNVLFQKGEIDQAIAHYRQAIAMRPDFAEAHYNLGHNLTERGELEDAITHYEKALTINPDDAEVHNSLGNVLLRVGRMGEAIAHYRQAIAIRSDFAEAHYYLGRILAERGELEDAITHYEKALTINPDDAQAHNSLGNVLFRVGRAYEAITHYQKALELQPGNADAHANLGSALLEKAPCGRCDYPI